MGAVGTGAITKRLAASRRRRGGAGTLTTTVIATTLQKVPTARIEMRRLGFFEVAADLEGGRVDVVFAPMPMELPERIRVEPLWREPRVLVTRADHPLAARESISIADTAKEIFVTAGGGPPHVIDWWVVDPRPDGTRPRRGPTADSVEGLLELVAAGAGVNIASESARTHYRRDELAYVRIEDIEPATLVLCSFSDSRNPMVRTFRETARKLSPIGDAKADTVPSDRCPDHTGLSAPGLPHLAPLRAAPRLLVGIGHR